MPHVDTGFTGAEIRDYIVNFIGNDDSEFKTFVEQTLPLAEFRFAKIHTWKWLNKVNLSLTVVSGTNEYTLNSSSIGFYMRASNVRNIFNQTEGIYLKKTTLEKIRRGDPKTDDGSATSNITHWAPIGTNRIMVYPKTFEDTTLKIDGLISPPALHTMSNYPTVPYEYQQTFIDYVLSVCLFRENDDRFQAHRREVEAQIRQDIGADVDDIGDAADEPRMKSQYEAEADGRGGEDLTALYDHWAWNSR